MKKPEPFIQNEPRLDLEIKKSTLIMITCKLKAKNRETPNTLITITWKKTYPLTTKIKLKIVKKDRNFEFKEPVRGIDMVRHECARSLEKTKSKWLFNNLLLFLIDNEYGNLFFFQEFCYSIGLPFSVYH